jgi:hypothetical protein
MLLQYVLKFISYTFLISANFVPFLFLLSDHSYYNNIHRKQILYKTVKKSTSTQLLPCDASAGASAKEIKKIYARDPEPWKKNEVIGLPLECFYDDFFYSFQEN